MRDSVVSTAYPSQRSYDQHCADVTSLTAAEMEDERLTMRDRSVLLALRSWADLDIICPSAPAIARRARCSRDSMSRAVAALIEYGYVRRSIRRAPGGMRDTNVYELLGHPHATVKDQISERASR